MSGALRLEAEEVDRAVDVSLERTQFNADRAARPRWGQDGNARRGDDLMGTLAEMGLAKWSGLLDHWLAEQAVRQHPDGDVGTMEARATNHTAGRLILHPDDKPDRAYVLIVVDDFAADGTVRLDVVGYYRPGWGLPDEWWREYRRGGGAYYVPRDRLRPLPQGMSADEVE